MSTKDVLQLFLVAVYRRAIKVDHATATPLRELAAELGLSEAFAEKVAEFLESQGLIDYDDQAVDITIPGMVRAEEMVRAQSKRAQSDEAPPDQSVAERRTP